MNIRREREADHDSVCKIHLAAFEGPGEAKLVDMLRKKADPTVSLVAENAEGKVIGHIMFSPVSLADHDIRIMGLAPVAVMPELQKKGYGSALINAGLGQCGKIGARGVVLLGHVDYYPRFGFKTSTDFGITSEYDVPAEFFMALEPEQGAFADVSGEIKYHPVFAEL